MFSLILAVICSGALFLFPHLKLDPTFQIVIGSFISFTAILWFFIYFKFKTSLFAPMQKSELTITPKIFDLYKKNSCFQWKERIILGFSVFSFAISFILISTPSIPVLWFFSLWLILFGFCLDTFLCLVNKTLNYITPYSAIQLIEKQAIKSGKECNHNEYYYWLDSLTETAFLAYIRKQYGLCTEALDAIPATLENYLAACSISEPSEKKVFLLFYLIGQLEKLEELANKEESFPICNHLFGTIGKIITKVIENDSKNTVHFLAVLEKWTQQALKEKRKKILLKASCTLHAIIKTTVEKTEMRQVDIKHFLISMVKLEHEIAKEQFRWDKSQPIANLTAPFEDLHTYFKGSAFIGNSDAVTVVSAIDQVLEEFRALETVLQNMQKDNKKKGS